eukprot:g3326.t1
MDSLPPFGRSFRPDGRGSLVDEHGRTTMHHAAARGRLEEVAAALRPALRKLVADYREVMRLCEDRARNLRGSGVLMSREDDAVCQEWVASEKEKQVRQMVTDCSKLCDDTFNAPDGFGCTPVHYAATHGTTFLEDMVTYGRGGLRDLLEQTHWAARFPMPPGFGNGGLAAASQAFRPGALRRKKDQAAAVSSWSRGSARDGGPRKTRGRMPGAAPAYLTAANAKDERGWTPLHFAAVAGSICSIRTLLR